MKKLKDKIISLIALITLTMSINVYADVAGPVSNINGTSMILIIAIVIIVCIFSFIILKRIHNKK